MNLVHLTPGTGGMYCGNCFRDNTLVAELRRRGHQALMVPLYLPLQLDEPDQSAGTPVFFGGINVYLAQKVPFYRAAPRWLRQAFSAPGLLARAAGRTAKTRAEEVGAILISMLHGPQGRQARELEDLVAWLQTQPRPDAVCLSNALLLGMAESIRTRLGTRVVCFLQGEDSYLDDLPDAHREPAWTLLRGKARDADLFLAPNRYYADLMTRRLNLLPERVTVVPDGIGLEGFPEAPPAREAGHAPVLGYFARQCPEKGLGTLVDAFLELHRRGTVPELRLKVGGGCGPADAPFVAELQRRIECAGQSDRVTFHPNLNRRDKIAFLSSLDVFSVPAGYPEAFGMYLAEALAAGVPVVQPRFASFPEFVEATGGGILYEPHTSAALADALEDLLRDPERRRALGAAGQQAVREKFSAAAMAERFLAALSPTA